MSSPADSHAATAHEVHAHPNYVKIWAILLALLVVSVVGPMFGVRVVTLVTAFGIAVVKAYLVATNFMHLNVEKKVVHYVLGACLALMLLFFFAVAPDVMKHIGTNWENHAAKNAKALVLAAEEHAKEHDAAVAGGHGSAAHGAAPSDGAAPHGAAPAEGAGAKP